MTLSFSVRPLWCSTFLIDSLWIMASRWGQELIWYWYWCWLIIDIDLICCLQIRQWPVQIDSVFSRRSDSWERREVKKVREQRGETGERGVFIFSRPFLPRAAPDCMNAWDRKWAITNSHVATKTLHWQPGQSSYWFYQWTVETLIMWMSPR